MGSLISFYYFPSLHCACPRDFLASQSIRNFSRDVEAKRAPLVGRLGCGSAEPLSSLASSSESRLAEPFINRHGISPAGSDVDGEGFDDSSGSTLVHDTGPRIFSAYYICEAFAVERHCRCDSNQF
jgi:hypothetical protein